VKSDVIFQDIFNGKRGLIEMWLAYNFHFDVKTLKNKQNDEKKNLFFFDFFLRFVWTTVAVTQN
jgi:hypothetical protein